MKLTEKNAEFAVVATAFHHGGVISFHRSLDAAKEAARRWRGTVCQCGCCDVVPVTENARTEMLKDGSDQWYAERIQLFKDLPEYTGNEFSPYTLCK